MSYSLQREAKRSKKYFEKKLCKTFGGLEKSITFAPAFEKQLAISLWRIAYSTKQNAQKKYFEKKFSKVLVV
ncbi:hypothetical protein CGC49_01705 [Capnocytophaga sp. H4358]|uniref:hypothetical protein n=1 Tax=Capnocytophaga sp. H4358 TaxID=1945658 RepID=UPI000BB1953D|nr:hypothetical protein [Capnocytophaga sp. H4358]ATA72134.1 hypothetical protein CGC49_01705 [Capnocytophaga sp. H4358]